MTETIRVLQNAWTETMPRVGRLPTFQVVSDCTNGPRNGLAGLDFKGVLVHWKVAIFVTLQVTYWSLGWNIISL